MLYFGFVFAALTSLDLSLSFSARSFSFQLSARFDLAHVVMFGLCYEALISYMQTLTMVCDVCFIRIHWLLALNQWILLLVTYVLMFSAYWCWCKCISKLGLLYIRVQCFAVYSPLILRVTVICLFFSITRHHWTAIIRRIKYQISTIYPLHVKNLNFANIEIFVCRSYAFWLFFSACCWCC